MLPTASVMQDIRYMLTESALGRRHAAGHHVNGGGTASESFPDSDDLGDVLLRSVPSLPTGWKVKPTPDAQTKAPSRIGPDDEMRISASPTRNPVPIRGKGYGESS